MIKRFRKVTNNLYRGGAPSVKDVVKLNKLFGIQKIVSLDASAGEKIHNICKMLNIEHIIIPLDGSRKSLFNLFSYDLKELLDNGVPTFVHCQEGKDRTGFVIALFKCKYLNVDPSYAIQEAEDLGFGKGVSPTVINLYKKIINSNADRNNSDIVSNKREYIQDEKSSALDRADRGSFAPYLDKTRQYPYDSVYQYQNRQGDTRDSCNEKYYVKTTHIPLVGLYDNTSGIRGVGPVEIGGGFVGM
jgi:hypothetical protein